jgi:hypothetical protein
VIIFLYRWKIIKGKESQFEENWTLVTKAIYSECGSYGSRLHLAENGEYVGYAQWPDLITRQQCELSPESLEARKKMRAAIEFSYPEQLLEIKSDLLVKNLS